MRKTLVNLFLALVLVSVLCGVFYQLGSAHTANAYDQRMAAAKAQAQKLHDAEVKRGNAASAALQAELTTQRTDYTTLEGNYLELSRRHAPLVVAPSRPLATAVCAAPITPGTTSAAAPPPAVAHDIAPDVAAGGDGGPALTRGAVWMWNSSLTGQDHPSGACGAADTSSGACDVATEITLQDAWDNHHTNAQLCAVDRLKYQRLIDYLQGRPE